MKREPAPQEYTCRNCPERYYHAIPAPQKSKGLMMHFGESYCTLPKRARHLKDHDLSKRAPEWCPKRKVPNTLRIYYYRSPETYVLDNVLHQGFAFTPLPTASRYAVAYEGSTKLSPREFWLSLLTQKDAELLGRSVKVQSVVEIDDGLARAFSSRQKKAIRAAGTSMLNAHAPTAWKAGKNIIRRT